MADKEQKVAQQSTAKDKPAKEKAKKPNAFVRFFKRVAKFFRDCKGEIKKIVWPTPKATFKTPAWCW